MMRKLLFAVMVAAQLSPALGYKWGGQFPLSSGASELSLASASNDPEYPFINLMKTVSNWGYSNNSVGLKPDELTSNGYPLANGSWTTNGGAYTLLVAPSQYERPGHYVMSWIGLSDIRLDFNGSGVIALTSCTGGNGTTFGNGAECTNMACSTFTGQISGNTLTVTVAPTGTGCGLGAGVPITGTGVVSSKFGTPTIITSAGSACGPNTCYTVNQSQTVTSETMQGGARLEVNVTSPYFNNPEPLEQDVWLVKVLNTSTSANLDGMAFYHLSDETAYESSATPSGRGQASILGALFKTRIKQANFKVLRDLDWIETNVSNCSTWATRKPITYFSYAADEYRNAASGPGQYVNATGSGASAGTISYNAGTDVYSISLGSGAPTDKQTFLALIPATGTTSSRISFNGTSVPILTAYAAPGSVTPHSGDLITFVYDAVIGGFLSWGGNGTSEGLHCTVPPEVFIEVNAELGTTPWHSLIYMALDPMTDWVKQYATYLKSNYSGVVPFFEVSNEPFNGATFAPCYFSYKSAVYISEDAAWTQNSPWCGPTGDIYSEIGKVASTAGQDLTTVFGAGNFEMAIPVQTYNGTGGSTNGAVQSSSYVNQTVAPTQSGYSKTPAYEYATRISVNDYWNAGFVAGGQTIGNAASPGNEISLGYCYLNYSVSTTCQGLYASQSAVMTAYMNSASPATNGYSEFNIGSLQSFLSAWKTWASTCSLVSRPGNCMINQAAPLVFYEGGYNINNLASDYTQSVTSATNAASAVLAVANNGCVVGQTVGLSSLTGGTWSSAAGSYTVTAVPDASHCTINLNSTSLGTLSAATLTYTGSAGYVTNLRQLSYTAPELDTLTYSLYNWIAANGGINPSQFLMANIGNLNVQFTQWFAWAFDIYGYMQVGQCSSCTISGSTLTLGGTITGVFRVGDTLFGGDVTGLGTGAASNTTITSCTAVGSNPCGTTSGDTLGLSQASTVSVGETMTGNATPQLSVGGTMTTSPVRSWGAICRFNGNGNQCNG